MIWSHNSLASRPRFVRLTAALCLVAAAFLLTPTAASAQLSRLGGSIPALMMGGTNRGIDIGYDERNGVYLIVIGNVDSATIWGVVVNGGGFPMASFPIGNGYFPRVEYGPNAAGGAGGFLVAWHNNGVHGRIVTIGGPASPVAMLSSGVPTFVEVAPAIAYSRSSGRFLVAWTTAGGLAWGIQSRLVDDNGNPIGGGAFQLENPGGAKDASLTWNPGTNEFGLGFTGWSGNSAFAGFRRVTVDGGVSPRDTFGFSAGTYATAIDVNGGNQFIVAWAVSPGVKVALFNPDGARVAENSVTSRFGHNQSLGMAHNPSTGTLVTVGSDGSSLEVAAAEIDGGLGVRTGAQVVTDGAANGSFNPLVASRPGSLEWDIAYSRDFRGAVNQIVGTAGAAPPPPPPPPPPDPTPTPTPTPTPPPPTGGGGGGGTTSGCTGTDPFISMGGGTCYNGGWWPPGMTLPGGTTTTTTTPPPPTGGTTTPPPPTGSDGSCTTSDPFISMGGGTCYNGGWWPPGMTLPGGTTTTSGSGGGGTTTPPPPTSSGDGSCTTPDPFVSIGGGICYLGGWRPKGS